MEGTALGSESSGQGVSPPPATPSNPVAPATPLTGGGGEPKSWREALPEDIRSHAAISSFQDVPSLVKSYIHAQGMVGKKGVIVPGEKATAEDWNRYYKEIGVPEVDKYEVAAPKEYSIPPETLGKFKEVAVKNGLLPKQANELLGWYSQFEAQTLKEHTEGVAKESAEQLAGLKKEWGDGYDKNLQSAQFAAKEMGGDTFVKYLNDTGLGNDVNLIRIFAKVAPLLGEDKLREGGVSSEGMTPHEIHAKIADIRANPLFTDTSDPRRPALMREFESLNKRLTGGR